MDRPLLRKELIKLAILAIAAAAIMKIAFYKQDIFTTTKAALAWWWMFTLPGYAMLYYWSEKLDFIERAIVGTAAAAALTAIASYYLGIIGLHVKYHGVLLPIVMIITGIAANIKMRGKSQ